MGFRRLSPVRALGAWALLDHSRRLRAPFGPIRGFWGVGVPTSSVLTQERLAWQPTGPGLIEDLEVGHYFHAPPPA